MDDVRGVVGDIGGRNWVVAWRKDMGLLLGGLPVNVFFFLNSLFDSFLL